MYVALDIVFLSASLALFITLISFFVTLVRAERSGAPFFPTPQSIIEEALRVTELRPGEKFYDLGCGTGRALLLAETKFHAEATGFELSTLFYCIARANIFLHRARARVFRQDLYRADLRAADVVFLFLVPRGIAKLEEKLKKRLRSGTRVISYIFPLSFWEPTRTIELPNEKKIFLYRI